VKFNEQSMASVIQGAIDGVMLQWVFDPEAVDFRDAKKELSEMFVTRVKKS
jgi:TetR/AcrR family transcriptional regulator, fatty acid metabolism regulator protein